MKQCEICNQETYLDKHHIISRSKGGPNKSYNIAYLCPNCHRKVHRGVIILEGRFMSCTGNILVWHHKNEGSITNVQEPECYTY